MRGRGSFLIISGPHPRGSRGRRTPVHSILAVASVMIVVTTDGVLPGPALTVHLGIVKLEVNRLEGRSVDAGVEKIRSRKEKRGKERQIKYSSGKKIVMTNDKDDCMMMVMGPREKVGVASSTRLFKWIVS